MQKIIGLIPARRNSKGIKNKNIALLDGKHLIEYTIKSALNSKLVDCYCSSDSDKIINIANEYNCKTIKRPFEFATDEASMLSVVKHFRDYLNDEEIEFDAIQILYVTYPFRTLTLINESIDVFEKDKAKSLIGLHEPKTHPYLCYELINNKPISFLNIDANVFFRRQCYPKVFEVCHAVCIIPKQEIDNINNQLYNDNSNGFIIRDTEARINIDTPDDLSYAEYIIKKNK